MTLWIIGALLIIIGIAGTILPALPGSPLVLIGLILAAWADDFQKVSVITLVILGFLTVLTLIIDVAATAMGAKKVGASSYAIWGAALGTIVGIFSGFVGLIFAPFFGALIGEYIAKQDLLRAGTVGFVTWIALIVGMALKLSIIFTMLGIFALAYFF